jgi:hypothetical protein
MRSGPNPALAVPALVLVAGLVLSGCSSSGSAPESTQTTATTTAGDAEGSGGGEGDFCAAYDAAGGTLATFGLFQVALPAEETVDDLTSRVEILDSVTPPDETAADWQTIHDLYAEALTIAQQTPEGTPVVEPRIFEIVDELGEPSSNVRDYLDATC